MTEATAGWRVNQPTEILHRSACRPNPASLFLHWEVKSLFIKCINCCLRSSAPLCQRARLGAKWTHEGGGLHKGKKVKLSLCSH